MFELCSQPQLRRILVATLVWGALLTSAAAMADEPRSRFEFVSENGRYVLLNIHRSIERVPVFEDGRYVGVMETKRDEPLWGAFDARSAQPLEPSNEAQTLRAGRVPLYVLRGDLRSKTALISNDGTHVVVLDDFSEQLPAPDLQVLHFYRSGKQVAAFRLRQVIENIDNIRYTSSHFFWFFSRSLSFDGKTLSVTTTECVPLVFGLETGEMSVPPDRKPVGGVHSADECPASP